MFEHLGAATTRPLACQTAFPAGDSSSQPSNPQIFVPLGSSLHLWQFGEDGPTLRHSLTSAHADVITTVRLSADGQLLASGSSGHSHRGGDVAIWDMSKLHGAGVDESAGLSAVCLARWRTHPLNAVLDLAWSADGKRVVACCVPEFSEPLLPETQQGLSVLSVGGDEAQVGGGGGGGGGGRLTEVAHRPGRFTRCIVVGSHTLLTLARSSHSQPKEGSESKPALAGFADSVHVLRLHPDDASISKEQSRCLGHDLTGMELNASKTLLFLSSRSRRITVLDVASLSTVCSFVAEGSGTLRTMLPLNVLPPPHLQTLLLADQEGGGGGRERGGGGRERGGGEVEAVLCGADNGVLRLWTCRRLAQRFCGQQHEHVQQGEHQQRKAEEDAGEGADEEKEQGERQAGEEKREEEEAEGEREKVVLGEWACPAGCAVALADARGAGGGAGAGAGGFASSGGWGGGEREGGQAGWEEGPLVWLGVDAGLRLMLLRPCDAPSSARGAGARAEVTAEEQEQEREKERRLEEEEKRKSLLLHQVSCCGSALGRREDGAVLAATGDLAGQVILWQRGQEQGARCSTSLEDSVRSLLWAPKTSMLLAGTLGGFLHVCSLREESQSQSQSQRQSESERQRSAAARRSIAALDRGASLALGSSVTSLAWLLEGGDWASARTRTEQDGSLSEGSDGGLLACGCVSGDMVLVSVGPEGELSEVGRWLAHGSGVTGGLPPMEVWSVAAGPGGQWVVTGSEDRTARVWSVGEMVKGERAERAEGEQRGGGARLVQSLEGHAMAVTCVAWTNHLVATSSDDQTIRLHRWNPLDRRVDPCARILRVNAAHLMITYFVVLPHVLEPEDGEETTAVACELTAGTPCAGAEHGFQLIAGTMRGMIYAWDCPSLPASLPPGSGPDVVDPKEAVAFRAHLGSVEGLCTLSLPPPAPTSPSRCATRAGPTKPLVGVGWGAAAESEDRGSWSHGGRAVASVHRAQAVCLSVSSDCSVAAFSPARALLQHHRSGSRIR